MFYHATPPHPTPNNGYGTTTSLLLNELALRTFPLLHFTHLYRFFSLFIRIIYYTFFHLHYSRPHSVILGRLFTSRNTSRLPEIPYVIITRNVRNKHHVMLIRSSPSSSIHCLHPSTCSALNYDISRVDSKT